MGWGTLSINRIKPNNITQSHNLEIMRLSFYFFRRTVQVINPLGSGAVDVARAFLYCPGAKNNNRGRLLEQFFVCYKIIFIFSLELPDPGAFL